MRTDHNTLSRREVRKIFKRHYGSQSVAARELGVHPATIALWLRGEVQSKRLDLAIPEFATRLAATEAAV